MDDKLQSVILGGLLHDIGKLIQRSGGIFFNETDFKNKKMSHSAYGYGFINKLLVDDKWDIAKCALYHHADKIKDNLKSNDIAYIIYEADNIAAGSDRRENDEIDEKAATFEREAPLDSIFNVLQTVVSKATNSNAYYLRTLEEDNPFNYPVDVNSCKATKSCYQEIEKILEKHLKDDKTNGIKGMPINKDTTNSLLQLLESTSSYIPSDTYKRNLTDISLYDHCKLTAAIASCMYLYFKDKRDEDYKKLCFDKTTKRDDPYFLLVSGDLSGVQDFIYTIATKGALKSLRARSFYLDLMLEHIVDEILEKLGLSRANLIYTGGGHFYMLLPNTNETETLIKEAETKINKWFLDKYGVALYLAMASEPCCPYDFMTTKKDNRIEEKKRSTKDVFRAVSEKLSTKKLQRYNVDQLKQMFDPDSQLNTIPKKNSDRECNVCHTSQHNLTEYLDFENICSNCKNLFDMGKQLVYNNSKEKDEDKTKVISIRFKEPKSKENKPYLEIPSIDNDKRYLVLEEKWMVESGLRDNRDKYVRIYTKNKWMAGLGVSTNLWMGDYNKKPEKDEGLIEFKELASKSTGINRLAVMRADVDNLGHAFVNGFDENLGTLSRYTSFSKQLSLFFKHYINNVCKGNINGVNDTKIENFKITGTLKKDKHLVIVYSGGDDIFIVGAWNDVIDFAVDLRTAFRKFTNGKLTFSAGIGFFSDSFPIYQMANLTGKLEDIAKDYPKPDKPTKDAVALFGIDKSEAKSSHVYQWDEFYNPDKPEKTVYEKVKFFLDRCYFENQEIKRDEKKPELKMSFLYKLLVLLDSDIKDEYSINLARLAYLMARIESKNYNADISVLKTNIIDWALDKNERTKLLTAINILIYLFRKKSSSKQLEPAKGGLK